ANTGIVTDPADYAADDWFEIYNPSTMSVELAGFHLTDNPQDPTKFTVPGGDLHVNFKLDQLGEWIQLRDPSGRLLDSVHFSEQTNNISQGRWPDGAATSYFMTVPTPRGFNLITSIPPQDIHIIDVRVTPPPNSVTLIWDSQSGRNYRVLFKHALTESAWTDLPGDVHATGPTAMKTDTSLGANTQRFYRIQLVE